MALNVLRRRIARQRRFSDQSAPKTEIVPRDGKEPETALSSVLDAVRLKPVSVEGLLNEFLGGRTKNTYKAYQRDLNAFAKYCGGEPVKETVLKFVSLPSPQAHAVIFGWRRAMTKEGFAPATQARRMTTIRNLVRMAKVLGLTTWTLQLKKFKVEKMKDTRGPTTEATRKLLTACGEGRVGLRNELIVRLLATLGLRRAEVIHLQLKDYDHEGCRLFVKGKGDRTDWMGLEKAHHCTDALNKWISAANIQNPDAPIVHPINRPGRFLSLKGLNYIAKQIGIRAGVNVWPHGLRHFTGTHGLDLGFSVREVQRLMRHRSVQTTMIYDDNRQDLGAKVSAAIDKDLGPRIEDDSK